MKLEEIASQRTIDWLLEKENPSVRYFTLINLIGKPESDAEVLEARHCIMETGVVPRVLSAQKEGGYWGESNQFYLEKYTGTVWQLLLLAELGAEPDDRRIQKACEFILDNSQDRESYGFSVNRSAKTGGGRHSEVIPCLTGNMIWSLIRLGYLKDERVQKGINWIIRYQRTDDGIAAEDIPAGWPYDKYEMCWGRHTCHMGVVKSLKALSAIPAGKRNSAAKNKVSELAEYLLVHHIFKKSHDLGSISKPGWLKPGFPLMYQDDILEILGILTELGFHDMRMNEALEIIRTKQNKNGKWVLENTFNGRMLKDIEEKGKESKWITLKALYVLANN
jgi:hypothetical protein